MEKVQSTSTVIVLFTHSPVTWLVHSARVLRFTCCRLYQTIECQHSQLNLMEEIVNNKSKAFIISFGSWIISLNSRMILILLRIPFNTQSRYTLKDLLVVFTRLNKWSLKNVFRAYVRINRVLQKAHVKLKINSKTNNFQYWANYEIKKSVVP